MKEGAGHKLAAGLRGGRMPWCARPALAPARAADPVNEAAPSTSTLILGNTINFSTQRFPIPPDANQVDINRTQQSQN